MQRTLGKATLVAFISFVVGADAFGVAAGFLGMGIYVSTYGISLWKTIFDTCKEKGPGYTTWSGVNCVANIIFYLVGAATSFGLGGAGSEYITNGGVTTFGKRDAGSVAPTWNWERVHNNPEGLYELLGAKMPGDIHSIHYNLTEMNLENSITVVKSYGSDLYVHSSNVTHGLVSVAYNATGELDKRSGYTWTFGMAGVKFSYANPGCQKETVSDTTFDNYLGQVSLSAAQWMSANLGNTYALTLSDTTQYGSPFVSGYLIAEENPFGLNYEGSPAVQDCFD